MYTYLLEKEIPQTYKNRGQHKEQKARYNLTGKINKADNIPFWTTADCNGIQIKSARATICKGVNIAEHIEKDAARLYMYVCNDEQTAYIMSKSEYYRFCTLFSEQTTESPKNGGTIKTRLKKETRAMIAWLQSNTK